MQKILPSLHLLEIFMPVADREEFMTGILEEVKEIDFYRGIELGIFFDARCRKILRSVVEEKQYRLTQWASPYLNERGYNLSSLDKELRDQSVACTLELAKLAGDAGAANMGLPSGPDPGDSLREEAKKALFESYQRISGAVMEASRLQLTLEPLDRYAHKKQLMGPMPEVMEWFGELKKECPNFYIHWDSAHEALGGIDLAESMKLAAPYMVQFHLCNCITDPSHPCYGDHHMEVGREPDFKTWGYLTPEVAAALLREASSFEPVTEDKGVWCAVEVRSHMGDDMWDRERLVRTFLQKSMTLAGLDFVEGGK